MRIQPHIFASPLYPHIADVRDLKYGAWIIRSVITFVLNLIKFAPVVYMLLRSQALLHQAQRTHNARINYSKNHFFLKKITKMKFTHIKYEVVSLHNVWMDFALSLVLSCFEYYCYLKNTMNRS
jgi:hypothetical protein